MKDFEKFDLNKKTETVATDNTLPPPPKPWELQIIRNIWRRAYLDSEEDHVKILKEYGQQARNEAIDECLDYLLKTHILSIDGTAVWQLRQLKY